MVIQFNWYVLWKLTSVLSILWYSTNETKPKQDKTKTKAKKKAKKKKKNPSQGLYSLLVYWYMDLQHYFIIVWLHKYS